MLFLTRYIEAVTLNSFSMEYEINIVFKVTRNSESGYNFGTYTASIRCAYRLSIRLKVDFPCHGNKYAADRWVDPISNKKPTTRDNVTEHNIPYRADHHNVSYWR